MLNYCFLIAIKCLNNNFSEEPIFVHCSSNVDFKSKVVKHCEESIHNIHNSIYHIGNKGLFFQSCRYTGRVKECI